ncbi:RNA polymerase sigma factor [Leptospira borgpetersenii]|uniref:RNA polymerase sigma subunit n=2 Tax=Leptospira borgpetersenii serovar Hardjo-bovis TaxID=338217 RepID=Q04V56_LEPBJ|nr:sigma-70 family RNA polymerase sigma factor [Leptospira borgpetersenii]ABJ75214.1 RNA polymerase sigma subunit [Leptospira borgpetersenii serovar Hardjo-bovis str. JB197]ABJ79925.1 RNA polymerase sigma subunit [Leptospira borgpetersenii serovar Hardjo-bovis str. L550]AMX59340.1 DNA-directed RNA polymerase sigma-70 factor [Leptospira borgpetersenii serovar Hardjo]AMX62568.1 DNA-directed RNA polymerase sigma-70 factor [Leptospira borgpetersenii serovar Hardjo]AMX65811.1 DNA-directed RNA polym
MSQNSESQIFDFDGLYSRNYEKIYRFLLSKGASKEEAEETCQETFIKVLNNWDKFDPSKGNETSWMFTIAKNQFLDLVRKKGTSEKREVENSHKVLEFISKKEIEYEEDKHQLDLLNASLENLPHLEKNIIILRFLRNYTIKETAEKLGISARTVNRKTYVSLIFLRKKLQNSNFDFESI